MSRAIDSHTTYVDRVVQLIPAEIVAAHLTIQGLVYSQIRIRDTAIEISAAVLLLLLPFYLRQLGVMRMKQICLTMGSFIAWVLAVSLPVHQRFGWDPLWGSIILILWTVVIPVFAVPGQAGSGPGVGDAPQGNGHTGGSLETRVSFFLLAALALSVPTVRAQDFLQPERLTSRTQFFSSPPGTVAFLPQVRVSEDATFAGQWDVLVPSGRYEVSKSDQYCFMVNHRNLGQAGKSSYVAIGALSVLEPESPHERPIMLFRNKGWSREDDDAYRDDNDRPKHVALTPKMFAGAHAQDRLTENDRLLTHRWHGRHGEPDSKGESWTDYDVWPHMALPDAKLVASLAPGQEQPDLRFDAKLLQFTFTQKRNSNQPVAFCLVGDDRIATILTVFSPHFRKAQRRFELKFQ